MARKKKGGKMRLKITAAIVLLIALSTAGFMLFKSTQIDLNDPARAPKVVDNAVEDTKEKASNNLPSGSDKGKAANKATYDAPGDNGADKSIDGEKSTGNGGVKNQSGTNVTSENGQANPPKEDESGNSDRPSITVPGAVEKKASSIANKDVEAKDFAKAAGVILGKLSFSEIKFLFDSASDDYWVKTPVEEIEKARNIIFSKLSSSDVETLRQLGKKYGRSMTILNADIDVAKTKEKQVAKKQAKN